MSYSALRFWVLERPYIRKLLYPANWIRQRIVARRAVISSEDMYKHFCSLVAEDPVLNVDEFCGSFVMGATSDIFKRLIMEGEYERDLVNACRSFIVPDRDIIDVGANIGFFSVWFGKNLDTGKVIAVEPTPSALVLLVKNLVRNEVQNKVVVYNGALSDREGYVDVTVIPGKEEYSTIGSMCHPSTLDQRVERIKVRSATVDHIADEYSLDVGFIKLDVEGMEHTVLKGANHVLEKHRPVVVSELSNPLLTRNGASSIEVVNLIKSYGYRVVDPLMPTVTAGKREYCDILCVPEERSEKLRDIFPACRF